VSPPDALIVACLGGAACGAANAAGLWWTTRRLPHVRRPAAVLLASFLVRTLATLPPVVLLGAGEVDRLVVALVSFVIFRLLVVRGLASASARSAHRRAHRGDEPPPMGGEVAP
jgi:F1F0 ATPase subunit 2